MHLESTSFFPHSVSITVEMVAFFLYESLNLLTFFLPVENNRAPCCNSGAYNWARGMWPALWKSSTCAGKSKHHPVSSLCVYVCVLFFQSVIVIPLAQSMITVMAQDCVNVRRALQGLSVKSVYPAICGTMAANVSRTTNLPHAAPDCSPPQPCLSLSLLSLSDFFSLCVIPELRLEECAAHAQDCPVALTNTDLTHNMS